MKPQNNNKTNDINMYNEKFKNPFFSKTSKLYVYSTAIMEALKNKPFQCSNQLTASLQTIGCPSFATSYRIVSRLAAQNYVKIEERIHPITGKIRHYYYISNDNGTAAEAKAVKAKV